MIVRVITLLDLFLRSVTMGLFVTDLHIDLGSCYASSQRSVASDLWDLFLTDLPKQVYI